MIAWNERSNAASHIGASARPDLQESELSKHHSRAKARSQDPYTLPPGSRYKRGRCASQTQWCDRSSLLGSATLKGQAALLEFLAAAAGKRGSVPPRRRARLINAQNYTFGRAE